MRILHLTPHIGGGVGTVILNWILADKKNNCHGIASLGYMEDNKLEICFKNNIKLESNIYDRQDLLLEGIRLADIVIVHYWNHPLLIDFLINTKLPECRLVFWFHNSGFNAPYVLPEKMIEYSDRFVFTTPITYQVETIKNLPVEQKEKLSVIWSTGGTEKYKNVIKTNHTNFNILHVGTLDYSKLHPDFVEICFEISKRLPTARFIVCGTGSSEKLIKEQVRLLGLSDKFIFTGWIENLALYLAISDVFLYPLNKDHYGTCEQVIADAMTVGLPVIVYDNPCECSIIQDCLSGLIVSNIEECCDAVEGIYNNEKLSSYMSIEAKNQAEKIYSMKKMIDSWGDIFDDMLNQPKQERNYVKFPYFGDFGDFGTEVFIESLGEDIGGIFSKYVYYYRDNNSLDRNAIKSLFKSSKQWLSESKGSVLQYLKYFPDDVYLNEWKELLKEI